MRWNTRHGRIHGSVSAMLSAITVKRSTTRLTPTAPCAVRRVAAGKRDEHGQPSFNATRSVAFTRLTSAVVCPRCRTPFGRCGSGHALPALSEEIHRRDVAA
jgi:hypothetical protein